MDGALWCDTYTNAYANQSVTLKCRPTGDKSNRWRILRDCLSRYCNVVDDDDDDNDDDDGDSGAYSWPGGSGRPITSHNQSDLNIFTNTIFKKFKIK